MSLDISNFSLESYLFNREHFHKLHENAYFANSFPLVYIIYDALNKIAYVGESTNASSRILNHLANPLKNHLKNIFIISSPLFNKSAALDIESNLIKYISADGSFVLLNANAGLQEHNYYQRNYYFEIFENIWEKLKLEKVVVKDILAIDNSDLFKYSPYKSLSPDQKLVVRQFLQITLEKEKGTTFIKGAAGTGKTIVAIYLMKLLLTKFDLEDFEDSESDDLFELSLAQQVQNKYPDMKIALVIPMTSLRKTLKNVFKNIRGLKSSMVIAPTEVSQNDYDILIVDESHRLKRRKNLVGYAAFDTANRRLGFGNDGTELNWVLMQSKHQVLFYDKKQSVKPTDVLQNDFDNVFANPTTNILELQSQMRVKGGTDYIKFVHALLRMEIPDGAEKFQSNNYDLRLYSSLADLVNDLEKNEKQFGLCRLAAGYAWPWISKKTKNPDAVIDGISLYWNRVSSDWINSTNVMNEMGCIHTTQGYDLNYAGIIFGHEIFYNEENGRIEVDKKNYYDANGRNGVDDPGELHDYILNIYTTLMFRGIRGTYVYVCDNSLRKYFAEHFSFFK